MCISSQVSHLYTTPQVQAAFRGSTFQSSCASPVLQHLNDDTVVNCYGGTSLSAIAGGGFTPTMATGSSQATCAGGDGNALSWFVFSEAYFPELANARSDAAQETTGSCPEGRILLRADRKMWPV